jgi:hypothetical protein
MDVPQLRFFIPATRVQRNITEYRKCGLEPQLCFLLAINTEASIVAYTRSPDSASEIVLYSVGRGRRIGLGEQFQ